MARRGRASPPGSVSFVMTLWLEPREHKEQPEWRWRVRHVQSGDEACFRSMTGVLQFIEDKAGVSGPV